MIIQRDGKRYRLNSAELERAYRERLIYHQRVAIDNRMQERADLKDLPLGIYFEIKEIAIDRYWEELNDDRSPDKDIWDKFLQYAIDVYESKKNLE